jgi:hypothetical protein
MHGQTAHVLLFYAAVFGTAVACVLLELKPQFVTSEQWVTLFP